MALRMPIFKNILTSIGVIDASRSSATKVFDKKTTDAKAAHLEKSKLQPYFNEYGWIYSDYFPDNFDGRSAAITYY
jgi:hypothetical protein